MSTRVLSVNEVRGWFDASGTSVSEWARERGLPAHAVYSVLSGRCRGRRGVAHRVALALGLKASPDPRDAPAVVLSTRSEEDLDTQ